MDLFVKAMRVALIACLLCMVASQAMAARSITIDLSHIMFETDERTLSFALDTAQIVGAPFWWTPRQPFNFSRERLVNMARAVGPAYLRIGGTTGDETFYAMNETDPVPPPGKWMYTMTGPMFDALMHFAVEVDFLVTFGLNLGPGTRSSANVTQWVPDNAHSLLLYATTLPPAERNNLIGWQLSNEPNLFFQAFGARYMLSASELAEAFASLQSLMKQINPSWLLMGPDLSFEFPIIGQVFPRYLHDILEQMNSRGVLLDVVTYHYYPMLSVRCTNTSLLDYFVATPEKYLEPRRLDKAQWHARRVLNSTRMFQHNADIWISEGAGSLCGGQPGVADRFVNSLWWIDQLSLLAAVGQTRVQARQTLAGSTYGVINEITLEARPDYFAALAWARFVDNRLLNVTVETSFSGHAVHFPRSVYDDQEELEYIEEGARNSATLGEKVRVYGRCAKIQYTPTNAVGVALIVVNLLESDEVIELPNVLATNTTLVSFAFTSDALDGKNVFLNGKQLSVNDDGTSDPFESPSPVSSPSTLSVPATSYSFHLFSSSSDVFAVCS